GGVGQEGVGGVGGGWAESGIGNWGIGSPPKRIFSRQTTTLPGRHESCRSRLNRPPPAWWRCCLPPPWWFAPTRFGIPYRSEPQPMSLSSLNSSSSRFSFEPRPAHLLRVNRCWQRLHLAPAAAA